MAHIRQFMHPAGAFAALAAAMALVTLPYSAASAQTKRVPETRAEVTLSFAPLVKKAAPAVVNIYTKRVVKSRPISPFFNDPFFRRFFGDRGPRGRMRERVERSLGSGVVVSADGLIVTNQHVIDKAEEIRVVFSDRREYAAEVVSKDERTDLAVLRIDPGQKRLSYLRLRDSDNIEVGDLVLAIGNPFGFEQSVTSGIVSSQARTAEGITDFGFFIQTDAAINPGNSGGALITMDGRLVGINTAIFSRAGGSNGIGFAIPSNMVATVIASARGDGQVRRPWIGASVQDVTSDLAQSLGLDRPSGVLVTRLFPGAAAARAGLQEGDVIVAVKGRGVPDIGSLKFRIATQPIGGKVDLDIIRKGRERQVNLPLAAAPEEPPRNTTVMQGRNPFAGAEVNNLSPAYAEENGLDPFLSGVIVSRIRRGSPANRVGLKPGDIVKRINQSEIRGVGDLQSAVTGGDTKWEVIIQRRGRTIRAVFGG